MRIERGDRDRHRNQVSLRQLPDQVEIGQHPIGFGGDGDRMARVETHLEYLARDPVAAFDRLVGIGIGPHRNRARLVAPLGQSRAEQLRSVGLREQLRFEIEPRRQIEVSMGGPREAVDAAMLAAPVGVDRTVERNVGRLVEIENRTRGFLGNFGAQLGGRAVDRLALVTPVAIRLARGQVEAGGYVAALCSSAFDMFHGAEHRGNIGGSRSRFLRAFAITGARGSSETFASFSSTSQMGWEADISLTPNNAPARP